MPFSVKLPRKCRIIVVRRATSHGVYVHSGLPGPNLPHRPASHDQEREKNVAAPAILERALDLIDCELEIVRNPERFTGESPCKAPDFGLHLAPKPRNLGIVGIAEIIVCLWLSEEIVGADGKPVPLIRLAEAFEYTLGMDFGDIYDKLDAILRRKPFNRTKALDYLRTLLIRKERESKKGG